MTLQTILKSQYRASLTMLLEAVRCCPAELWTDRRYANPCWQVAYHTLFYAHLYLQPSEAHFVAWQHHRPDAHQFRTGPEAASALRPYSTQQILAYGALCLEMVDSAVDALDLEAPDSGFSWYRMSKLEHQFVSLRHLQHHTGQLADRLRQAANRGVAWVGGVSPS